MARFNAAKMIGAIDQTFQDKYNNLIDLLDTKYLVEATIDGKKIKIEISPKEGLAFYQDSTKRGGIEVINELLTLAIDIMKSPSDSSAYVQFSTEEIGGVKYGVTTWKVWNDSDHTQYFTNLRLYSGADSVSTFTGMESVRDGTTSLNISVDQETSAEKQPVSIVMTSVDDADGDPSLWLTVENKAGAVMSIDMLPTDVIIRSESATVFKAYHAGNVNIPNVPIYANNAAALAGGLVAGDLYRTNANPDPVCIVH